MIKEIQDYGIIGDLYTAALIGKDGSMDWLCLPYLDSPSVFGFLLDAEAGGRFLVEPVGRYDSVQSYLPQTNILVTDFRTSKISAALDSGLRRNDAVGAWHQWCRAIRRTGFP